MKKHTKAALIVASCLSIGATFLMIHPSQAFFLDLPQQKNGIRGL
jgi:putative lipoprotein